MKILLLGSGGREHALARKISESPLCEALFIAPGNPGTLQHGINIPLNVNDFQAIKDFCVQENIGMVVVGPEDPLVNGIYDFFQQQDSLKSIHVIGPSKLGAQLEGSKAFAKAFMQRHQIPTAAYREFDLSTYSEGEDYLRAHTLPIVLKADGLAAGKGVVIAETHDEALDTFRAMIQDQKFGAAGSKVVIEQFLTGIECSVFAITDGKDYVLLPSAKDYKRIGEGDTGLNTGGMGAISPVPFIDDAFMQKVTDQVIIPTIKGIAAENIVYKGFVFFGLIKVGDAPYVIEYNCRMGDPETEVVMPRLESDLVELLLSLKDQQLAGHTCVHSALHAATVMLVSKGYPEDYEKGKTITGLDGIQNSILFHAGTRMEQDQLLTNGGRVLAITSLAPTLAEALQRSKKNAGLVEFDGKTFRNDIGWEF
ncbi:MAG: phosphoribosylamine--glycine ligase [Chitinophagaceae bacterium]|nr:phosphoribosylamine--glycine ligase [Chitinophagaceae bacterium]